MRETSDQEMKNLDTSLVELKNLINTKIDSSSIKPIWKHLERFALYEDLKHLHNMVIPEIAKFE